MYILWDYFFQFVHERLNKPNTSVPSLSFISVENMQSCNNLMHFFFNSSIILYTSRPPKDPFYDNESEERDIKNEEDAKKLKQRQTYIKRVIVHPSFHNISFKEAERLMDQMDQGEVIVRPSSKVRHLII